MANDATGATAILAGGCFWCLEAMYERVPGVIRVESGYTGGKVDNPDYRQVCGGGTGHAEAVRITFDPARVTYGELLDLFWKIHDPTTLNRQGADVGEQYRSAIFWLDEAQEAEARASAARAQAGLDAPVVTRIERAGRFWPAEQYHQGYYRANGEAPYCRFVIAPKLAKAGFGE